MTRFCALLGASALALAATAAPVPKDDGADQIKLKDHINVKMSENLHSERFANNNLKELKAGKQKLGTVTYEIGEGVLQLGSAEVKGKPEKIEGIKVGRTAAKLHFLQGAGYSAEDGKIVGRYVVHYADKTKADVEIVYGKHVVDWWAYPCKPAPTESKAAWEGENAASKEFMAKIKLYQMTWTNPHPDKAIATIDFVAADQEQICAPFCAAITVEAPKEKKDDK
jgi:hypothetical protein